MLNGLSTINIELTSRCNKKCWMCGRRKIERDRPELAQWGDIDFVLVQKIAQQLPPGIVVQLHNNGEPLLYPKLREVVELFENQLTTFNTNGILLVEKAPSIIGVLNTVVVSVVQNDSLMQQQYENVIEFAKLKGYSKPLMVFRLLGAVPREYEERYRSLGTVATRILHDPMGSRNYEKQVTVPEIGVCLDLLHHMAIDRHGNVSLCVRFDPDRLGVVGNANEQSLDDIWNGERRHEVIYRHLNGQRNLVPLCSQCEFWGVPTRR